MTHCYLYGCNGWRDGDIGKPSGKRYISKPYESFQEATSPTPYARDAVVSSLPSNLKEEEGISH